MKRTICALLAVFLLLSLLPLNAAAAQSGELNGAIRWSLDDSGTLTISGTGAMPDYVYNYTYDGWSMSWSTRGDWQYMAYADQIRSVVVGEGITSVGMGSFMYMPSLQSVRLPDSVRTISAMAFFGCQALTDINVPAELEEIGDLAFKGCSGITSLILPGKEYETPAVSRNAGAGREQPVNSYLYRDGDAYVRVENINGRIVVERYDSGFRLQSARSLESDLFTVWGGFFAGETYNFIITGRENREERSDAEVLRIRKYAKDWTLLDELTLYGQNTQIPFHGGSVRCAEAGGVLWIHTCHQMFKSSDGHNHQANMTFSLRESDMELLSARTGVSNISTGYVSHSFNQYVMADRDGQILFFDHGDAYPRAAVLCRKTGSQFNSVEVQEFPGAIGDNTTGGSLGGLAETDLGYLTAYNYNGVGAASEGSVLGERTEDPMATRNVYLGFTPKRDFSKGGTTVRKVTDYEDNGMYSAGNPVLVATGENEGYLIWEVLSGETGYYGFSGTLAYVRYGMDGSVSEIKTLEGRLSDCQPIAVDGKAVWYVTDGTEPAFYVLDDEIDVVLGPEKPVSSDAGAWTNLMISSDWYSEELLEKICTILPDRVTVTTNYERELELPVYGWTLDREGGRWLAEVRAEDLPDGMEDPNGVLDQVSLVYEKRNRYTNFDVDRTPELGQPGGFRIFTVGSGDIYTEFYHITEQEGEYAAERMPAQEGHQTDSAGRILYTPDEWLYYNISAWQRSDAGDWLCMLYLPDGQAVVGGILPVSFPGEDPGPVDPGPVDPGPKNPGLEVSLLFLRPEGGTVLPGEELRAAFDVTNTGDTELELSGFRFTDANGAVTAAFLEQREVLDPGESLSRKAGIPVYVIDSVGPEDADRSAETEEMYGLIRISCTAFGYAPGTDEVLCEDSLLAEISLLKEGHVHEWEESFTVDREPTCTQDGIKSIHCRTCTAVRDQTVLPALEHSYAGGVCVRCGAADPNFVPGPADSFLFDDVRDSGKFYYYPVYWAYNHSPQITNGISKTMFGPDAACTRGQVVTFLWRAAGCPEPKSAATAFKDLKEGGFYLKAVAWAVENGITNGTSPNSFSPDAKCTRGQIVTFLWRFRGSPAPGNTDTPFTDLKPGGFYLDAVSWAVDNGITNGVSKTTFGPDDTCTRGQVVTFLYRATSGKD